MERDEYQRLFSTDDQLWWFRARWQVLARTLRKAFRDPANPPLVLDAGCGTGANLLHLKQIARPVGLDLSPDALAFAKQRAAGRLVRGSVLVLPFRDHSFDAVMSNDVLYHQWVTDDVAAIKELARVLKPGGLLMVHVAAMELFRGSHDVVNLTRHRYTVPEMKQKLRGAGLQVERVTYRNTLLAPVLLARRAVHRSDGHSESDLAVPSAWLNNTLTAVLGVENAVLRLCNMPFGSSVFAIARKPGN